MNISNPFAELLRPSDALPDKAVPAEIDEFDLLACEFMDQAFFETERPIYLVDIGGKQALIYVDDFERFRATINSWNNKDNPQ